MLWDKKLPMPPPLPPPFLAPGEVSGPDHALDTESVTDPNTREAPIAVRGRGEEGQREVRKATGEVSGPDHALETESATDPNTREAPIAAGRRGQEGQRGGRRQEVRGRRREGTRKVPTGPD